MTIVSVAGAQGAPEPPYYSVQLMSVESREQALRELQKLGDAPGARAEFRDGLYLVRVGTHAEAEPARVERDAFRDRGATDARVVRVSRAVEWIRAGDPVAAPAPVVTPPTVVAQVDDQATPEPQGSGADVVLTVEPRALPFLGDDPGGATGWRSALISLEQIGWRDGFSLEGSQGVRTLFFTMPPGVVAERAQLAFDVEFGDLLIPQSTIQFRVNGTVRRAIRRGETSNIQRVELPLSKADLEEPFIELELTYSLFLTPDTCFARHLAGAYARFAPGGGLAVVAKDSAPRTVRAAWSLLPADVRIAARLSALTPAEFQSLFRLASTLAAEGHTLKFETLTDAPTEAHIVVAPADRYVRTGDALEGAANLRLISSGGKPDGNGRIREERTFILVDSTRPLPAADMMRLPWRHMSSGRLVDAAAAEEWPQPRQLENTVRLEDLGFADSERRFSFDTAWQFALPFGPLGDAQRPSRASLELFGPRLPETEGPVVISAYYNDRLVYSTSLKNRGEKEVLDFELPRVQLRARNNLKLVAQRDEIGAECGRMQAAYPLSLSPSSIIETKPLNERPGTFAELVPHQRSLELYVSKDAIASPDTVIPMLVAMGHHFWPDVPAPELRLFAPGDEVEPDGPFFVVGAPRWQPAAPVQFDEGRVRLRSNATGDELMLLDFASDTNLTVLQMVEARGYGGAWLRTTGGYLNVPSKRQLFEDENLAFLGAQGIQAALRVGPARDYRVDYPEARGWFSATGAARTVLFVVVWVVILGLLVYLYRRARRHREL